MAEQLSQWMRERPWEQWENDDWDLILIAAVLRQARKKGDTYTLAHFTNGADMSHNAPLTSRNIKCVKLG